MIRDLKICIIFFSEWQPCRLGLNEVRKYRSKVIAITHLRRCRLGLERSDADDGTHSTQTRGCFSNLQRACVDAAVVVLP